ncbi:MAG: hypothetical protein PWQ61_2624, partial [Betaproteobacteria bacterium]|nr:hypothetical protein [Betaproteobacteria bacterium]
AHRHAAGVQGDDLVVEAGPAGLVLGDQLGFEGEYAITWFRADRIQLRINP